MENNFFKSVIDADDAPVVICDLEHTIVYMNPTALHLVAQAHQLLQFLTEELMLA